MTCTTSTISMIQGDTYTRTLLFKDKNNTVINLTGSVLKFSVKKNISDTAYILQVTLTLNIILGSAVISTPMSMDIGVYVYDFEWTQSDGSKTTLEIGKLVINNGVS